MHIRRGDRHGTGRVRGTLWICIAIDGKDRTRRMEDSEVVFLSYPPVLFPLVS